MLKRAIIPSAKTRSYEAVWAKSKMQQPLMYRLFAKIKSMFLTVSTLAISLVLAFLYRRK